MIQNFLNKNREFFKEKENKSGNERNVVSKIYIQE